MSENNAASFFALLDKYRNECFSERDNRTRFERLMQMRLENEIFIYRSDYKASIFNECKKTRKKTMKGLV